MACVVRLIWSHVQRAWRAFVARTLYQEMLARQKEAQAKQRAKEEAALQIISTHLQLFKDRIKYFQIRSAIPTQNLLWPLEYLLAAWKPTQYWLWQVLTYLQEGCSTNSKGMAREIRSKTEGCSSHSSTCQEELGPQVSVFCKRSCPNDPGKPSNLYFDKHNEFGLVAIIICERGVLLGQHPKDIRSLQVKTCRAQLQIIHCFWDF